MLDKHLVIQARPFANEKNVVRWGNYRVTVLQDRLFRLERSENGIFRDEATKSVWYRDMPAQEFSTKQQGERFEIQTSACKLILYAARKDCRIEYNGKIYEIDNQANLKGTSRTLDNYDGDTLVGLKDELKKDQPKSNQIKLGDGVCSRNGIAVFDDVKSLTLGEDGALKPMFGDGSDEYVFVYGDDYREAVKALYMITGQVPMIPRFALGNWWSRYHVYSDKEYLRLLNSFEEQEIPLTVATIDMDWHYSNKQEVEDLFHVTALGRMNKETIGALNITWTGYTWNKRLFPDYKAFLGKIQEKNLKITLNLHPADGIRYWEEQYEDMAKAVGVDTSEGKYVPFDIASETFINAYFKILHKPYEKDGVAFWWIDWQQGTNSKMEGLDPLWSLNHYHYLDNALNHSVPLILSRYCGIGSHRYPVGFSGDTFMTWDTLKYLPEFTATASNIGYTWWSHDIGGHMRGYKDDEMYLRHLQYGVFSPINRLHCGNAEICTKEPWAYRNGTGEIAKNWLRFRHRLIPYLYTASYRTHKDGIALIEPLYYEWKDAVAYKYKNEYLFGGELLVAPVTNKAQADGYARTKMWLPQGKWTDIFTGAEYNVSGGGKEIVTYRDMESIPVLIREGGILPLSRGKGNSVHNPKDMEILVYAGNGEYELYEDGAVEEKAGALFTRFVNTCEKLGDKTKQVLKISTQGDWSVVPSKRNFALRFKNITDAQIRVFINGEESAVEEVLTDCSAVDLVIEEGKQYQVELCYTAKTEMETLLKYAWYVLSCAEGRTVPRDGLWRELNKAQSIDEYVKIVDETTLASNVIKARLKETV